MFPNEVLMRSWFRRYRSAIDQQLRSQIGEHRWPRLREVAAADWTPKESGMNPNNKSWLAVAALSLIWGSSFLWIKVAVQEVGPMTLVAFRLLFGLLALLIAARVTRQRLQVSRKDLPSYAIVAALNTAVPFTLISWGATRIDSGPSAHTLLRDVPRHSAPAASGHYGGADRRDHPGGSPPDLRATAAPAAAPDQL